MQRSDSRVLWLSRPVYDLVAVFYCRVFIIQEKYNLMSYATSSHHRTRVRCINHKINVLYHYCELASTALEKKIIPEHLYTDVEGFRAFY